MGTHEAGPGYPRHRDYPGIRHGGTDGKNGAKMNVQKRC